MTGFPARYFKLEFPIFRDPFLHNAFLNSLVCFLRSPKFSILLLVLFQNCIK